MKPTYRRIRRRSSHESAIGQKENRQENLFFGNIAKQSFFQPTGLVQRKCEKCEEEKVHKKPDDYGGQSIENYSTIGYGTFTENKVNYANCAGVNVRGHTTANYSNSYSADGQPQRASDCAGCTGNECIRFTGNVISVFRANPRVSLPAVPAGLTPCEQVAVQNFIDTTIAQHEQQHVDAFNTYAGTVTTPVSFTGCRVQVDEQVRNTHNNIEVSRRNAANALSDALDPFNPPIPCDCPDPEPPAPKK